MSHDLEIPFDRVTYREGQRLTARDMEDDRRREARLRSLHNLFLHHNWGIALGLEVVTTPNNSGVVRVKPGHAIDDLGRDILLAETIELAVPAVAGPENFVLTLNYQDDAVFRERRELKNICLGSGLDPRRERPHFTWRRPAEVYFGPQIPIVQVVVQNGQIQDGLDMRVRRHAQPLARPHIGLGMTEPGRSGWRDWLDAAGQRLGLELVVDTSEAGFNKPPSYFATLHADASLIPEGSSNDDTGKIALFLDGLRFITDIKRDSFVFRIIQSDQVVAEALPSAAEAEKREWYLSWFGLEPVMGCEPEFNIFLVFLASGFLVKPDFGVQLTTGGS